MPILRTALGFSTDATPATTNMHFRLGAVGWQYLITILLKMVDHKQIASTDRVSTWFAIYPYADLATVRMLAASSAGFGDYVYGRGFDRTITAGPLRRWTAGEIVARSLPPMRGLLRRRDRPVSSSMSVLQRCETAAQKCRKPGASTATLRPSASTSRTPLPVSTWPIAVIGSASRRDRAAIVAALSAPVVNNNS